MKKRKVIYCAMIRGFYEFALAEDNSPKTFVMNELEIGKLYEVLATDIFTNRLYKTKDVFRVVGFEGNIPLIRFVYRKEQLINIGGASFSIDSILSVIKEFERFGTSVGMWENEKPNEKSEEKYVKAIKTQYVFDAEDFEKFQSKYYPTEVEEEIYYEERKKEIEKI